MQTESSRTPVRESLLDVTVPDLPGNLFLRSNSGPEYSFYIRFNGRGAFVGCKNKKLTAWRPGMEHLLRLLQSPDRAISSIDLRCWLTRSFAGADFGDRRRDGHASTRVITRLQEAELIMAPDESEDVAVADGYQTVAVDGVDWEGANKQVERQIDAAVKVIGQTLPELGKHLTDRICSGHDGFRYTAEGQWTFGNLEDLQAVNDNNLYSFEPDAEGLCRIRFRDRQCFINQSEGVVILALLLRHPGKLFDHDTLLAEVQTQFGSRAALREKTLQETHHSQNAHLASLAREFLSELREEHDKIGDEGVVVLAYEIPGSASELIEDLMPVQMRLYAIAREAGADFALAKRRNGPKTEEMRARWENAQQRLRRCDSLIRKLRDFGQGVKLRDVERMVDGRSLKRRVTRYVDLAIAEIMLQDRVIGEYFKKNFRSFQGRVFLNIRESWVEK